MCSKIKAGNFFVQNNAFLFTYFFLLLFFWLFKVTKNCSILSYSIELFYNSNIFLSRILKNMNDGVSISESMANNFSLTKSQFSDIFDKQALLAELQKRISDRLLEERSNSVPSQPTHESGDAIKC